MNDTPRKPYTAWVDYGYEGWKRTDYETLEAALKHNNYGSEMVVTKLVQYDVVEKDLDNKLSQLK